MLWKWMLRALQEEDKINNQGTLGQGNRTCIRTVIKIVHPIVSFSAIGFGSGRIHLLLQVKSDRIVSWENLRMWPFYWKGRWSYVIGNLVEKFLNAAQGP